MGLPPATTPPPRTSASLGGWGAWSRAQPSSWGGLFPRSVAKRQRGLYSRERPPRGSRNTQSAFTLSGDFYFQLLSKRHHRPVRRGLSLTRSPRGP